MAKIKFAHTNIIARNWKELAQFYIKVFDCKPIYPERDLSGEWLDKATNIENCHLKGIHLQLPGFNNGPTLEIFQYNHNLTSGNKSINKEGIAHLAFVVDDIEDVYKNLKLSGGEPLGEVITKEIVDIGILTFLYAYDPEGNIVEIQSWS